jgi:glycosyltransferase involved in cell wall biosynthesis
MVDLLPFPSRPLVSIVIPSFNQGAFIRETIESCLAQDYRPIEVIVVDGQSSDSTLSVLASYDNRSEVRWISEPDDGVADAVNKGIGMARGVVCGIQSSDDTYRSGAIAHAVRVLEKNENVALVYADTVKVDQHGNEISRSSCKAFSMTNFLSKRTLVLQPAAFFLRHAFLQVGGWSRNYYNADTECWLRMVLRYGAVKVEACWGRRRMHPEQRDASGEAILESYCRMVADCTEISSGPLSWRLAAACGLWRHELRYMCPRSRVKAWWIRVKSAIVWPPTLMDWIVRDLSFFACRAWHVLGIAGVSGREKGGRSHQGE